VFGIARTIAAHLGNDRIPPIVRPAMIDRNTDFRRTAICGSVSATFCGFTA
jgi:hypothetical protein